MSTAKRVGCRSTAAAAAPAAAAARSSSRATPRVDMLAVRLWCECVLLWRHSWQDQVARRCEGHAARARRPHGRVETPCVHERRMGCMGAWGAWQGRFQAWQAAPRRALALAWAACKIWG
jgi:hypothetical protein